MIKIHQKLRLLYLIQSDTSKDILSRIMFQYVSFSCLSVFLFQTIGNQSTEENEVKHNSAIW